MRLVRVGPKEFKAAGFEGLDEKELYVVFGEDVRLGKDSTISDVVGRCMLAKRDTPITAGQVKALVGPGYRLIVVHQILDGPKDS